MRHILLLQYYCNNKMLMLLILLLVLHPTELVLVFLSMLEFTTNYLTSICREAGGPRTCICLEAANLISIDATVRSV